MNVSSFVFNDFSENTYLLYDDTGECVIVDPGCNTEREREELVSSIKDRNLTPKYLINTHCHIDHVLGNKYISDKYNLELFAHKGELPVLEAQPQVASMYGIPYEVSPTITCYLKEGESFVFGNTELEIRLAPGHSPASIVLYHPESKQVISGDVLFHGSIGRADLPGGDYDTLIHSIKEKLFTLPDDVKVYPGHGPTTTIGYEKRTNPFFQ